MVGLDPCEKNVSQSIVIYTKKVCKIVFNDQNGCYMLIVSIHDDKKFRPLAPRVCLFFQHKSFGEKHSSASMLSG